MTPRPTTSKVLLVADGRAGGDGGPTVPVRRYRLARILPEYRAAADKAQQRRRA